MMYAVQRYVASRPWARRVSQHYLQSLKTDDAARDVASLLQRELERAAQVYSLPERAFESELLLADAFGLFVRHGRMVSHFESELAKALSETRLPAHLPDTLDLPAETFFLHVEGQVGGGAFVIRDAAHKRLSLLLLSEDFTLAGREWLGRAEALLSLAVDYPGELAVQIDAIDACWQPLLSAVLNGLALMTQPKLERVPGWEATAPAADVALASHPSCVKTRQKGRASLLKAGYQQVTFCRMAGLADVSTGITAQGYWRRQACGDDKQSSRLVWIAPR